MRIGIDCRLWNESGVGRYIRNLIEHLLIIDKRNQYVLFVLAKDEGSIKYKVLSSKYTNWKIVKTDIRWHSFKEQLRFLSILNKHNLDLVHFPYISVPIFYNKPFVVTIHDLIPYHFPTGEASTLPFFLYQLKQWGYRFVISQAAKKARKIIAVSNATKDEIVDHLRVDPSKVVVAYEGTFNRSKIKNQKSKIPASRQGGQIKNKKYFLYVGNAYPHKNLERLIEAFTLLCHPETFKRHSEPFDSAQDKLPLGISCNPMFVEEDPSTRPVPSFVEGVGMTIGLVLVGKEDYFYKRLKDKVRRMGLEESILFFGEVTDEKLSTLYKNAQALIIPSFMEGFGLPVLEAMTNKCLVLASDIPAIREICKDAAIYFDPYNIEDIAQKIKFALQKHSNDTYHYSDKVERDFDRVKRGFERAKMFSWEKMARETLKTYENYKEQ